MHTQNDRLEQVTPKKNPIFGIYVRFLGCILNTICLLKSPDKSTIPQGSIRVHGFHGPHGPSPGSWRVDGVDGEFHTGGVYL